MTTISLYTLTSGLHAEVLSDPSKEPFLQAVTASGQQEFAFDVRGSRFEDWNTQHHAAIYIRTGGTEGLFRDAFPLITGPVTLLTSGSSNSLAASMEILSFLRRQGREGRILHGTPELIARQLVAWKENGKTESPERAVAYCYKPFTRSTDLHLSARYGVVGRPSDWLISSDPDGEALASRLDATLVNIPIRELIEETQAVQQDTSPEALISFLPVCDNTSMPAALRDSLPCALAIYKALKHIVERYELSGVTVRCFDLLDTLHNTGCLALALLNAEGIPAACEGDIPALVSMAVARKVTGVNGFQANPSRIDPDKGDMVLAHCTAPLDILRRYTFDTHFESGIGVAIRGEIKEGAVTLFKLSPNLDECFVCEGVLIANLHEKHLCRTQLQLHVEGVADYFLNHSIGNHHIILPGSHAAALREALGV